MRVLLCKIQCPSFICFSKPSPHIYTSSSLKLKNTPPQVSFSTTTVAEANDDDGLLNEIREEDCAIEEKEEECVFGEIQEEEQGQCHREILKSSLKKEALDGRMEEKKQVQWVDVMGKELAEIREFECSEEDDIGYDGDKSCVCIIL
ncbi:Nuclear polyadenylated RNA-binding protein [Hirschfeldia incana]|nr:Nuclear polyadenylated RNA-binding protein [Hirschfeldia incana]